MSFSVTKSLSPLDIAWASQSPCMTTVGRASMDYLGSSFHHFHHGSPLSWPSPGSLWDLIGSPFPGSYQLPLFHGPFHRHLLYGSSHQLHHGCYHHYLLPGLLFLSVCFYQPTACPLPALTSYSSPTSKSPHHPSLIFSVTARVQTLEFKFPGGGVMSQVCLVSFNGF